MDQSIQKGLSHFQQITLKLLDYYGKTNKEKLNENETKKKQKTIKNNYLTLLARFVMNRQMIPIYVGNQKQSDNVGAISTVVTGFDKFFKKYNENNNNNNNDYLEKLRTSELLFSIISSETLELFQNFVFSNKKNELEKYKKFDFTDRNHIAVFLRRFRTELKKSKFYFGNWFCFYLTISFFLFLFVFFFLGLPKR
jgi:hypothetical protein